MELIKTIDAEKTELPVHPYDVGYNNGLTMAKTIVMKMDAVPVVRCAKCKYYDPSCEYCRFWHSVRHPEHYCAEGEKMQNEHT